MHTKLGENQIEITVFRDDTNFEIKYCRSYGIHMAHILTVYISGLSINVCLFHSFF